MSECAQLETKENDLRYLTELREKRAEQSKREWQVR